MHNRGKKRNQPVKRNSTKTIRRILRKPEKEKQTIYLCTFIAKINTSYAS